MARNDTEEQKAAEMKGAATQKQQEVQQTVQLNSSLPLKKPERLQQRKPPRRLLRDRPKPDDKQGRRLLSKAPQTQRT